MNLNAVIPTVAYFVAVGVGGCLGFLFGYRVQLSRTVVPDKGKKLTPELAKQEKQLTNFYKTYRPAPKSPLHELVDQIQGKPAPRRRGRPPGTTTRTTKKG